MTLTPLHLLRDTCLVAAALTIVGLFAGEGLAMAMSSLAATVNLAALALALPGITPVNFMARVGMVHIGAFAALAALLSVFHAVPVIVGFLAPVIAAAIAGVRGLWRPVPSTTAEHG